MSLLLLLNDGTQVLVAGTPATFAVTGGVASFELLAPAATGTISLTGGDADFEGLVAAAAGSFATTGGSSSFLLLSPGSAASFVLTGGAASTGILTPAGTGSFSLTGGDADFEGLEPAAAGNFAITAVDLGALVLQPSGSASFVETAGVADFQLITAGAVLVAAAGAFTLNGGDAGMFVQTTPFDARWTGMVIPVQFGRRRSPGVRTMVAKGARVAVTGGVGVMVVDSSKRIARARKRRAAAALCL